MIEKARFPKTGKEYEVKTEESTVDKKVTPFIITVCNYCILVAIVAKHVPLI